MGLWEWDFLTAQRVTGSIIIMSKWLICQLYIQYIIIIMTPRDPWEQNVCWFSSFDHCQKVFLLAIIQYDNLYEIKTINFFQKYDGSLQNQLIERMVECLSTIFSLNEQLSHKINLKDVQNAFSILVTIPNVKEDFGHLTVSKSITIIICKNNNVRIIDVDINRLSLHCCPVSGQIKAI